MYNASRNSGRSGLSVYSTMMSSTLGKREQLQTPDATPTKRAKITSTLTPFDSNGNKENVPPLNLTPVNEPQASPLSSRAARALRRNATGAFITPPRVRGGQWILLFLLQITNTFFKLPKEAPRSLLPSQTLQSRRPLLRLSTCYLSTLVSVLCFVLLATTVSPCQGEKMNAKSSLNSSQLSRATLMPPVSTFLVLLDAARLH